MQDFLLIENKKFLSTKLAAKSAGYTSDYVGQLYRAQKIEGRMVGRNLYVNEESLLNHKNSAQLVSHSSSFSKTNPIVAIKDSQYHYKNDARPLLPPLKSKEDSLPIPIHKIKSEKASSIEPNAFESHSENPNVHGFIPKYKIRKKNYIDISSLALKQLVSVFLVAAFIGSSLSFPDAFTLKNFSNESSVPSNNASVNLSFIPNLFSSIKNGWSNLFASKATTDVQNIPVTTVKPVASKVETKGEANSNVSVAEISDGGIIVEASEPETRSQPVVTNYNVIAEVPENTPSETNKVLSLAKNDPVFISPIIVQGLNEAIVDKKIEDLRISLLGSLDGAISHTFDSISKMSFGGGNTVTVQSNPFDGTLASSALSIGGSATSTFANGIDVSGGCFSINGTCINLTSGGAGSGVINSSTAGNIAYYASNGTTVSGTSALFVNGSSIGVGTTSPFAKLSVNGDIFAGGDVRGTNFIATGTLAVSGTGTSTFANGIALSGGCFSVNGSCIGGSTGGSSFAYPFISNATSTTLSFTGGLLSTASTTIGNGTQIGGLTVSGGATTTGTLAVSGAATLSSTLGVTGLSTLSTLLATGSTTLQNFTAINATTTSATTTNLAITNALRVTGSATSTFANGLDVIGGCFSVNGVCLGGSTYGNTDVATYINGSTTIPKTYTANTFTALQTLNGGLTLGSLTGTLQAINGVVSASSTLSTTYGGTGLSTAPSYGNILVGNATGGYTLTATSSLGLNSVWNTSGSNAYYTAGNVGVGTAFPLDLENFGSSLVSVQSSSGGTLYLADIFNKYLTLSHGTTKDYIISNSNQPFGIYTNSQERFSILGSGEVGIGSTSPSAKLSVSGSGYFSGNLRTTNLTATGTLTVSGTGTSTFANGIALSGGCITVNGSCLGTGSGTVNSGTTGQLAFYGADGTAVSGTSSLAVATSGNVGIGTETPDQKVTISQNSDTSGLRLYGFTSPTSYLDMYVSNNGNPRISTNHSMVFESGTSAEGIYFRSGSTGTFFNDSAVRLTDFNNGQLRLITNGNLGIGTTSPFAKLSVNGDGFFGGNIRTTNITATGTLAVGGAATLSSTLNVTGLSTLSTLLATGSTTLQNFTALNSTTTNATTTNLNATNLAVSGNFTGAGLVDCNTTVDKLLWVNGQFTCGVDGGGSGSGGGTWATTSSSVASEYINFSNNNTDIIAIGGTSTSTAKTFFDPNTNTNIFSGKVGVGTTSPFATLSVNGDGFFGGNIRTTNITATGTLAVGGITTLSSTLNVTGLSTLSTLLATGSTTLQNFTAINATTTSATTTNLAITNALRVTGTATSTFANGLAITGGCVTVNGSCIGTGSGTVNSGTTGQLAFYGADGTAVSGTSSLIVSSAGNVGIGTTSSVAKLDIYGTSGVNAFQTTSDGVLRTQLNDRGIQTWYLNSGSAETGSIAYSTPGGNPGIIFQRGTLYNQNRFDIVNKGTTFNLYFSTDGATEGLNIAAGGSIGIGSSSPSSRLTVKGNGYFDGDIRTTNVTATGTLAVAGAATLSSTLNVTGLSTLSTLLATGSTTLQNFTAINATTTSATTTNLAVTNALRVTGTATSTFANGIALSGGCFSVNGSCIGGSTGGSSFAYPFSVSGNATSTLTQFNGGLTSYASTTIGNGTATGGLTVSGNATTTGTAYFANNIGIGTTSPSSNLAIVGPAFSGPSNVLSVFGGVGQGIYLKSGEQADVNIISGNGEAAADGGNVNIFAASTTNFNTIGGSIFLRAGNTAADGPGGDVVLTSGNGQNFFGTGSAGNIRLVPGFNLSNNVFGNVLLAQSGGKVGVGTTSPFATLSVNGDGFFGGNIRTTNITATGTLAVSGATVLSSTLNVTGLSTLSTLLATGSTTLQNFTAINATTTSATTTNLAITNALRVTGIATSTFANGLALTGGCFSLNGVCIGGSVGGSSFAYPFISNATSTLLAFTGGLLSTASTTIGNGTATGGLTVSGNATTTGTAYFAGNVGIGTTSPFAKLSVNGDGFFGGSIRTTNITATGTLAVLGTATSTFAGNLSLASGKQFEINGAGILTRTATDALILGNVTGNTRGANAIDIQGPHAVDQVASGDYSIAFGMYNKPSGFGSVTLGIQNTASAGDSFTFGGYNDIEGYESVAVGYNNYTLFQFAQAFGAYNDVEGNNSGGFGLYNYTQGRYSSGFGISNETIGEYTSAFGYENYAYASTSVAFGYLNEVDNYYGSAFGLENTVTADGASVFGSGITNTIASSTQIGPTDAAKLTILGAPAKSGYVGIGTTSPFAKLSVNGDGFFGGNVRTTNITATGTLAVLGTATSTFAGSVSIVGNLNLLASNNSMVIGHTSGPARGNNSIDIQVPSVSSPDSYYNSGDGSVVIGNQVWNHGSASSTVVGFDNGIEGSLSYKSSIFGNKNRIDSTSPLSSVFGYNNYLLGSINSTIIGQSNDLEFSDNSSAYGYGNTVRDNNSSAFGVFNLVSIGGATSTAIGYGNTVSAASTTAIGNSVTNNIAESLMLGPSNAAKVTILGAAGSIGYVGIGTTSPFAKLSVNGDGFFGGNVRTTNLTATGTLTVSGTGTSTFANGIALSGGCVTVNGSCIGGSVGTGSSFAYPFIGNATSTMLAFTGGLLSTASTTIGNGTAIGGLTISGGATTTGTAYFVGNVGVGTTSPSSKLSVNGDALIDGNINLDAIGAGGASSNRTINFGANYGNSALILYDGGSSSTRWGWGLQSSEMQFYGPSGGSGHYSWNKGGNLQTSGTNELMRLDMTSGNLGVGTTSPFAKLSINGDGFFGGNVRTSNITATGTINVLGTTGTSTFNGDFQVSGHAYFGNLGAPNGSDEVPILVKNSSTQSALYGVGLSMTNIYAPDAINPANNSSVGVDIWNISGLSDADTVSNTTIERSQGLSILTSVYSTTTKNVTLFYNTGISVYTPTKIGSGATSILRSYGIDIQNQNSIGAGESAAIRIANNNPISSESTVTDTNYELLKLGTNNNVILSGSGRPVEVYGNVTLATSTDPTFAMTDTTNNVTTVIQSSDNYGLIGTLSNHPLFFSTNAGLTMTLLTTGEVGVGTTSPLGMFAINPVAGVANQFVVGSSTRTSFIINNSGNVGIGTSSPYAALAVVGSTGVVAGKFTATSTATSTFTFIDMNGSNGTSTVAANFWVKGTLRAFRSYVGDLIFSNGFRFLEGTSTPDSLILQNAQDSKLFTIDANGNMGLGTDNPSYKLQVVGDVAANAFVNTSTRDAKEDISYLTDNDKLSILDKIKDVKIARYHYKTEDQSDPLRLGLIAEEAPSEVLSVSGKGVDIYKLSTFILAGVQELQTKVNDMDTRVATLEDQVKAFSSLSLAGTITASTTEATVTSSIASFFTTMGVKFTDTIAQFKDIVASSISANKVKVEEGITIKDKATGLYYCVVVENGVMKNIPGECGTVTSTPTPTPSPTVSFSPSGTSNQTGTTTTITTSTTTTTSSATSTQEISTSTSPTNQPTETPPTTSVSAVITPTPSPLVQNLTLPDSTPTPTPSPTVAPTITSTPIPAPTSAPEPVTTNAPVPNN